MEEWLRWRNGAPLHYNTPADMPYWIYEEWDYLVQKYGKQSLTPDRTNHNQAVQEAIAQMQQSVG